MVQELTGLAGDVAIEQVRALMSARAPDLLEHGKEHQAFVENVRGITTEVVAIVGNQVEKDTPRWDAAVWCITLGVAAVIEASLFPEQQLSDASRARQLEARFQSVKTSLGTNSNADGSTTPAMPRSSFPDADPYPDPARLAGPWGTWDRSCW